VLEKHGSRKKNRRASGDTKQKSKQKDLFV